ncbi:MAG: GGDEF domain-containing protein [Cyanobacteria bacterium P01_G01_bin.39]
MLNNYYLKKSWAQWQANHDDLTGLVNRREFERQFSQLWENKTSQVHSLLYMDLDRFKIVNDTCGHDAGDELLRQISQVLQAQILESNTLARLGGDEFAAILYGCSQQDALTIAEAILNTIQKFSFVWQEQNFTVGISIGLISFKPQEDILTSVLKTSDAACYGAKNSGRNQIYVIDKPQSVPKSQAVKLNKI